MMNLTPTELERLTIFSAAELARKRRAKGLRLSYVEAIAYITDEVLEGARGGRSRPSHHGRRPLRRRHPADRDLPSDPAREAAGGGRVRHPRRGDHAGG